jgi:hypothetical protein
LSFRATPSNDDDNALWMRTMKLHLTLAGIVLFLLLMFATPSPCRATTPITSSSPVLLAEQPWYKEAYDWLAHWLNNRTRMIQFAVIGMIIALIIICRNRW